MTGSSDHCAKQGLPDDPAGLFVRLWQRVIAPTQTLTAKHWPIAPDGWRAPMRIVMVSDLHMAAPYMPLSRLDDIVARAQALTPDLILLPGDLTPGPKHVPTREPPLDDITARLARLTAPLGRYAVLGNHDWWDDAAAQDRKAGPVAAALALEAAGIPVLSNRAVELPNGVWLAGLESQEAINEGKGRIYGRDDLDATLAQVPDGAPVILMAHEPNIFPKVPDRVALTVSGHTHGGQIRLFGWPPIVPSTIDRRYVYGHIREGARHLVISAGLGYSKLPIRIGTPPEITVVDLSAAA
ncbi:putative metallophosphoesterase [Marinibacterium anthonyi]|nr:putative metallophosphoesterase [Marinibacterium anthonyi]